MKAVVVEVAAAYDGGEISVSEMAKKHLSAAAK